MCLPQVIKSFQNYRGVATTFYPTLVFPTRCNITQFIYFWKIAQHVTGGNSTHHQENTHNCIYSIWYLSNRCCYMPLLWKGWNWFECGVGIVLIVKYRQLCFDLLNFLPTFINPQHFETDQVPKMLWVVNIRQ